MPVFVLMTIDCCQQACLFFRWSLSRCCKIRISVSLLLRQMLGNIAACEDIQHNIVKMNRSFGSDFMHSPKLSDKQCMAASRHHKRILSALKTFATLHINSGTSAEAAKMI